MPDVFKQIISLMFQEDQFKQLIKAIATHIALNGYQYILFLFALMNFFGRRNGLSVNKLFLNVLQGECIKENVNQGRSYENNNFNISDCFFVRSLLYSGDGGVIYIYPTYAYYSLNVFNTLFYNCSCSIQGGAIFFRSSYLYLNMICASRCSSNQNHFALLYSTTNNIYFISVSKCASGYNGQYSMNVQGVSDPQFSNSNSSMNSGLEASGIRIDSSCTCYHCTFANNSVSQKNCIQFNSNSGTMYFINIIQNYSPNEGIIRVYGGSPKFHFCIFDMNLETLFYVAAGSIEVSHSFINHNGITSSTNNNSLTKRQTYFHFHFKSHYCNADNPIPKQSPFETPNTTPIISKTLISTPIQTKAQTPLRTNDQTPLKTKELTPIQTKAQTPLRTNAQTPLRTNDQTPLKTKELTPIQTKAQTPLRTNDQTPLKTKEPTPFQTNDQTPHLTREQTHSVTRAPSPDTTPQVSIKCTVEQTFFYSPTISNIEPPYRTYDFHCYSTHNQRRGILVIFSLFCY